MGAAGYDTTTPVVVTNPHGYQVGTIAAGPVNVGDVLLSITAKEYADAVS